MSGSGEAVLSVLEASSEEIGETLSALVRIPTTNPYSGDPNPSGEAEGQKFAAERMKALDGEVEFVPVPGDVYARVGILGPRERDWTGRQNVIGRFRFGSGATKIVLNGHMDTVGVSDYEGEPFTGERDGDLVHGRGASDCKGGIVAGLFAVKALRESGAALDCEIIFESVVDEECNGAGAGTLACCLAGIKGRYCIVLDGMAGLIYNGCQGVLTAELTVRGRAGHGSVGGVNAVEKLLVAKRAIDRLAAERAASRPGFLINVGVIRAGLAPWTVPNHGWLSANINYSYEEAIEAEKAGEGFSGTSIRKRLEAILAEVAAADDWLRGHPPELVWVKDVPTYRMEDAESPEDVNRLLAAATDAFKKAWDTEPDVGELHAWGDAAHLTRTAGMPVVGMGTGEPGTSHTATEFNKVSNVRKIAAAVALTIQRLCSQGES